MNILNSNISTPLYLQLYDILNEQVKQGVYKQGEKIPSEDKLCETYQVSRVTVRGALAKLVEDDVLAKRHGKGTFVSSPVFVESANSSGSFTKSCLQMNAVPGTLLIDRGICAAEKAVAKIFGIESGCNLIFVKRLRLANSIPTLVEIDYFTEDFSFMLTQDVEHTPMLEIIKNNTGLLGRTHLNTFEVKYATKELAQLLKCPPYSALLGVSQTVYSENRNVLYYNEQFIRSDIYKYVTCG